ncbi:hypothetical protein GCM10012275_55910 [Longimycelium tulufanense]|uniref:Uncharacterized protein n=1 Tax=Longimycelium tulufanense TaxID=907463 RepID=A0A8J3FYR4_9PSEU|nr:hypothetical protein [Longimycelium tulufanense]GGM78075.1 hypothetical protein GCM10012275_55910 [Longimycelium tulufanense]
MYGWIWRHLPGPLVVKIVEALFLTAAVVALLLFVVFPWVEPMLPFNQVTTDPGEPVTVG